MVFKAGWLSVDRPEGVVVSQHEQVATQRPGDDTVLKSNSRSLESLRSRKSPHKCQRE